ncbi:hypothetical protein ACQKNX_22820 [Lysinibacillus sp. NPDC093712]|uniref:hypothetical protein n=1 Tax=Lysinibacillus sp. NPDC093712 TaxID=3390579 RepID=UPI003D0805DD
MIEPFQTFSGRKYKEIKSLFYDYNNHLNDDKKWLFERFDYGKYDDFPEEFLRFVTENYENYDTFKNHLFKHTNESLAVSFSEMASDFRHAAYACATFMLEGPYIERLDKLIFPLAYLYRHSLELLIKGTILKTNNINLSSVTTHDLKELLNKVNWPDNLESFNPHIEWLKSFLDNFSTFDKMSDSFRYPFKINSESNIKKMKFVFEEQRNICIVSLVKKFEYSFEIVSQIYNGDFTDITVEDSKELSTDFLDAGTEYYAMSVVGRKYNQSDLYLYADSYNDLAEHLFKQTILDKKDIANERYFKPICYLLQNAIEVQFKAICMRVFDHQSALKLQYQNKHDIKRIWNKIYEQIKTYGWVDSYKTKLDLTFNYLSPSEVTVPVDTHSFRYPVNKNGQKTFKDTKFHIGYVYFFLRDCFQVVSGLYYDCDEQLQMEYELREFTT